MRRRTLLASTNSGDTIHKFVEIGGVKWATMNIGAETETDYGLYFSWGDTVGYTSGQCGSSLIAFMKPFYHLDYKFNGGRNTFENSGMTKYNTSDKKTVLDPSDDAARLHWGGDWRMPTIEEFEVLVNAVTTAWTTNYKNSGVDGLLCTDKTNSSKKLFFPAAGFCVDSSFWTNETYNEPHEGFYLSSTRGSQPKFARYFYFGSSYVDYSDISDFRYNGNSIRPVLGL